VDGEKAKGGGDLARQADHADEDGPLMRFEFIEESGI
jgi:hypothetical protein